MSLTGLRHTISLPSPELLDQDILEFQVETEPELRKEEDVATAEKPTEHDGVFIPDGGARAWISLGGAFCGFTGCMGIINSNGAVEQYIASTVLSNEPHSSIGWIFSLFFCCCFGMLIVVVPIFDLYGSKVTMTASICLFTLGYMSLSASKELYQFILSSFVAGFGLSFTFGTCVGVIGHHFRNKRAFCLGIGFSGGAVGGIIFPVIMRSLFPRIGYPWTMRTLAFVIIALFTAALLLMKDRRKEVVLSQSDQTFYGRTLGRIRFGAFKNKVFALLVMTNMCSSFTFLLTLTYIVSFGVAVGNTYQSAVNLTIIMNATSIVGRSFGGYFADKYGRFNVLCIIITLTNICYLLLWIPTPISHTSPGLIVFSAIYGVTLGSNISLAPSAVGQISKTSEFSSNYATNSVCTSLLNLASIPVGGSIIGSGAVSNYDHLVIFISSISVFSWMTILSARYFLVGFKMVWV